MTHIKEVYRKMVLYSSGILGLKADDVILASYPRSGNTWIRFFLCHLISLKERNGEPVDFEVLNKTMPEFGVSNLMKSWSHETIPRVVKTHKKCWFIFNNKLSILVLRDPRDVMVSYFHFQKDRKGEFKGQFKDFIRNPQYGLRSWFRHYDSWRNCVDLTIKYEDMKRDDVKEFSRIINLLDLSIEEGLIRKAAERSSIENVNSAEVNTASNKSSDAKFTRNGSTKQWKEYFNSEDLEYYEGMKENFGINIY